MIYVDELSVAGHNALWPFSHACHLFSVDSNDLHAFAQALHVKKTWFWGRHPYPCFHHYFLSPDQREEALQKGAREMLWADWVLYLHRRNQPLIDRPSVMERFSPSDFDIDGVPRSEYTAFRADLWCVYETPWNMLVQSQHRDAPAHRVAHNGIEPTACDCSYFQYRGNCLTHFARVRLVLFRAVEREIRANRDTMLPLARHPFSFYK